MADKKVLLYDGTILTNILRLDSNRSGIFFVVYNVFKELLKRPNLEIKLYCEPLQIESLKLVINTYFSSYPGLEIINDVKLGFFMRNKSRYRAKRDKHAGLNNSFKKNIYRIISNIFGLFVFLEKKPAVWTEKLSEVDLFLAPAQGVPSEIAGEKHIKKFVILHDTIPLIFPQFYAHAEGKNSFANRVIKTLKKEDRYFANSENTKKDFIRFSDNILPEHITVIPLSSNLSYNPDLPAEDIKSVRGKYKIPEDRKYFLSVCTLEPRKNIIFAVKNFLKFIQNNNIEDTVFVMSGGYWDTFIAELGKTIKNFGSYAKYIINTGYVPDEDMNALYCGAIAVAYPSLYEGFGMPILEAMKCGTPVICSNTSSMPEIIGDCGITINPYKDEDIINAYVKMYFSETFRTQCRARGLARAKLFTWEKAVDLMEEKFFYEKNPCV